MGITQHEQDPGTSVVERGSAGEWYLAPRRDDRQPVVWGALRRYWFIVLIAVVLFGGAGYYAGSERPLTYEAEARLAVGKPDPTSPSFGGFVAAASSLAATYGRAIDAEGVVVPVARELRLDRAAVRKALTASPIPESPVLRVIARTDDPARSVALANAAGERLIAFTTRRNRDTTDSRRLLELYRRAALLRRQADSRVSRARRARRENPSPETRRELELAGSLRSTAEVRATALAQAYTSSQQSQAVTELLSRLTSATSATSDRRALIQTGTLVGALAGLVLGLGLALMRWTRIGRDR